MIDQMATAALLLVAVAGVGLPAAAHLGGALPFSTRAALVPLAGLSLIGLFTLVTGHLGLLGPWLPYGLAAAGAATLWVGRRGSTRLAVGIAGAGWSQARQHPVVVVGTSIALGLAALAAAAPPFRTDEVEYHWPAALEWAEAGRWTDSSYRHVDGFPFMEVLYTAAATQGSYLAAHLLHLITLVALGFAAAGVGRAFGVRGSAPVAAAAMVMPVAWDGAYVAYNDTAVGAFSTAALAVVAGGRGSTRSLWLGGALVAIATSIKPSGVAAIGVLGLVLLLWMLTGDRRGPRSAGDLVRQWLVLAGPPALALAFWLTRQRLITGSWANPMGDEPPSADALSRLPSDLQQLVAPLLPFVSGIMGGSEPWGGRTSLVVQVLLIPALGYVLWRGGEVRRRFGVVTLAAWAHWVVLGLAIVRTRFHIMTWAMLVVSVRIAVEDAATEYPRTARWLEGVWTGAVLLGLVDVSLEMLRLIRDQVL